MISLVIGAGVSGLTCGIGLLEAGFETKIITREEPLGTTSATAAAVWYPYKAYPQERVLAWGKESLDVFYGLAGDVRTGVSLGNIIELCAQPTEDPWWKEAVRSFRRADSSELRPGYVEGFVFEAPIIDPRAYLPYLLDRFLDLGGKVDVIPDGISSLADLAAPGRIIVNCSGVWAADLVGDPDVYPIRGQVVWVTNPGLTDCVFDETGPLAVAYIVPRQDDVVLGGTAEAHEWRLEIEPETTAEILSKARQLEPRLADAEVLAVRVGLRPGRRQVRLEHEVLAPESPVIHNYGHGGAGFTLGWGCAEEVTRLAAGEEA